MIRRKNFVWDGKDQMYKPKNKEYKPEFVPGSARSEIVINLFRTNTNPKKVAKEAGFKDYLQMAEHMEKDGFKWSMEDDNYVKVESKESEESDNKQRTGPVMHEETILQLGKYLPLLELLKQRKKEIIELLDEAKEKEDIAGQAPATYSVKGKANTKNIYMSRLMANKLEEFSSLHNITQRQIVEAALVRYFRDFNYEVELILN